MKKPKTVLITVCVVALIGVVCLYGGLAFMFGSESAYKLEVGNAAFSQNKVKLPYSLKDYDIEELYDWYFTDLTAKVKEHQLDTDYWMFEDNYDLLFSSDGRFYVRRDSGFAKDFTSDAVSKIVFSEYPSGISTFGYTKANPYSLMPELTSEETAELFKIIKSTDYSSDTIDLTKYIHGNNTCWYVVFYLQKTDSFDYSGLCVADSQRYYIMQTDDKTVYLRDLNGNLKKLPDGIASKISSTPINIENN